MSLSPAVAAAAWDNLLVELRADRVLAEGGCEEEVEES